MNTKPIAAQMIRVARRCGKMILSAGEGRIAAEQKTNFRDLVTDFDRRIQEYAVRALADAFPGAGFLCEEGDAGAAAAADLIFVIDPIDGTSNFVHHFRHSCTSIACLAEGQPAVGVVFDPYADELFSAERGSGAFLNGRRLAVDPAPLKESLVLFGTSPYDGSAAGRTFDRLRALYGDCQDLRRSGSAALDLCYVAAGRAGAFFEERLSLWDYAAGALLVTEAGGVCTQLSGAPLAFDGAGKSSCAAGSAANVAALTSLL